ncbi:Hypothetical_protein [Hexamita inflata]|uniref:Hypothetical_protein n=1 Tax=Hexamita inflata TaxID=28002 RepID=A0AA86P758_9EUKA|nr:Hypothetical protein HINF_LOCUS19374 [Hexamita inflata]
MEVKQKLIHQKLNNKSSPSLSLRKSKKLSLRCSEEANSKNPFFDDTLELRNSPVIRTPTHETRKSVFSPVSNNSNDFEESVFINRLNFMRKCVVYEFKDQKERKDVENVDFVDYMDAEVQEI